jgi:hypothetical protein
MTDGERAVKEQELKRVKEKVDEGFGLLDDQVGKLDKDIEKYESDGSDAAKKLLARAKEERAALMNYHETKRKVTDLSTTATKEQKAALLQAQEDAEANLATLEASRSNTIDANLSGKLKQRGAARGENYATYLGSSRVWPMPVPDWKRDGSLELRSKQGREARLEKMEKLFTEFQQEQASGTASSPETASAPDTESPDETATA